MIIHNPKSPLPAKLRGLHLFHDGVATCAQRVRFALAEKGIRRGPDIPWNDDAEDTLHAPDDRSYVSRSVSIRRKEHLTSDYGELHPNLVVPALVHDGVLHIESVDLLAYIEQTWPTPPLVPSDAAGKQTCADLVAQAKGLHRAIRFMLFRWALPGSAGKLDIEQQRALRRLERPDSPEALADFYETYSRDAFADEVFVHHLRGLERGFADVDDRLSDGRAWLLGDAFSHADIMWSLKMLRLWEIRYPFDLHFPALGAWFDRVRARPTFQQAVWRDTRAMSAVVRMWSGASRLVGGGVQRYAAPAPQLAS